MIMIYQLMRNVFFFASA